MAILSEKVARLKEEKEALSQAFGRRNAALQASQKRVTELRETLTKERAVAFGAFIVFSCIT